MAEFIKTDSGAATKFPYELKDSFRAAFPKAKWNKSAKQWEVGSRSATRLQQWLAEIDNSRIEADLATRDAVLMIETEIASLARAISSVRGDIKKAYDGKRDADDYRARAEALRAELEAAKAELQMARDAQAAAKAAAEAVAADIDARVSHIATRAQIESLRTKMRKNWVPKAYARPHFDAAQDELLAILHALREVGVECDAARKAVNVNFNRKVRDLQDLDEVIEFVAK